MVSLVIVFGVIYLVRYCWGVTMNADNLIKVRY